MTSALRRGLLVPTVFAVIGFVVLTGLGVWQLERKVWKEDLLATLAARLAAPPSPLPPSSAWASLDRKDDEFRRVTFHAEFRPEQAALVYATPSALRPDVRGTGFWVFAPARLADRSVVVNRGFVPESRKNAGSDPAPSGVVEITGILRWPESPSLFAPAGDLRQNVWFIRDHAAIAATKKWGAVAPFYIDMEAPQPPGALPRVAPIGAVKLPNNHLQYALTWFGLAGCLAGVYLVWLLGRRRRAA
ncbi:MAG: SURF1 family protein [Pseudolabrys sp.]